MVRPLLLCVLMTASSTLLRAGDEPDILPREDAGRIEPMVTEKEATLLEQVAEEAEADPAAAVRRLRDAVSEDGSAALDFALGVFLIRAERHDDAATAFRAAVDKLPRFRRAWKQLGAALLRAGKPADAAAAFLTALRIGAEGEEASLWKLAGTCHLSAGNPTEAETCYRQALLYAPRDEDALTGLARAFLETGRAADAVPVLERLVEEHPRRPEPWTLLANARLVLDRADEAAATLESARRLGILGTRELLTLGDLHFNRGLHAEALALYDQALREETVTGDRALRCAEAAFGVGEHERARAYLTVALERGPERLADARFLDGRLAEAEERPDAAREAYEDALTADPLHGETMLASGRAEERAGRREKALLLFERAARIPSSRYAALLETARIHVAEERYEDALDAASEAYETQPSRSLAKYIDDIERVARVAAVQ